MIKVPAINVQGKQIFNDGSAAGSSSSVKRKKPGITDNLATHVPDFVLATSNIEVLPYSQKFEGVLLFADISGFTALCEKYSMDSRSGSGTDKLSRTLNSYLSDIIDNIMGSEGDILKFAGDAFLCLWKVKTGNVDHTMNRVIQCGLRIQRRCDNRHTDIGVNLRVKLGVSIGSVRITTIGKEESRHYVLSGPAVDDANQAEKFSLPGTFVLSPKSWAYTPDHEKYDYEVLSDEKHVSMLSYMSNLDSDPNQKLTVNEKIALQMSGNYSSGLAPSKYTQEDVDKTILQFRRASGIPRTQALDIERLQNSSKRDVEAPIFEEFQEDAEGRAREAIFRSPTDDEKARLRKYIIKPVLQKIDDELPLEYLSEMRQVSVLFVNLIFGSRVTSIERSDNERRSLQIAFSTIYDAAKEYGGCLNKVFMFDKGCTYIVIFGLPGYKHEDDCARALRSAYRMCTKLKQSGNISQASIGVTSGSSFCGVVGHPHRHEYTVIGKKVNMAARLMMHYPGKVSCDPETFHHAKLPRHYFHELPQREMKGVRNPGIIHEFIESEDYVTSTSAKEVPQFKYPLLGRDQEMSLFLQELHAIEEKRQDGQHVPFIFIHGDPGVGKTRFLDAAIEEALKDNDKVISCALSMNDSNTPYFIVRALISMLLAIEDCKNHVEREHQILFHIQEEQLREELCLLNDLLGLKFPMNPKFVHMGSEGQTMALHKLIRKIVHMFTRHQCIIFAVDDAHYMDNDSWEFLNDFAEDDSAVCIITTRSDTDKKHASQAMDEVLNHPHALHLRLQGLASNQMAPLACQLLEVVQVPEALVKILKEKSHGVPSWCEQLIREMIGEDQLQIVPLNGSEVVEDNTSFTPGAEVLKKRRDSSMSSGSTRGSRRASIDVSSDQSGQALLPNKLLESLQQLSEDMQSEEKNKMICVVSPGVDISTVQIPDSMKGMILTRIDHMKPSEQMVLKCASVLGMNFTRKMLEVISPSSNTWKIRRLLHSLMQSGVFECAASHFNHLGIMQPDSMNKNKSKHHIGKSSHVVCLCPEADHQCSLVLGVDIPAQDTYSKPISNCRYLRFTSSLMQETAYDLFLNDQRKRLHRTAALYLESQAHKCDACGGGEFTPGNDAVTGVGFVSLTSSSTHVRPQGRRMGVDGDGTAPDAEKPTESHFSIREKTSHIFDAVHKSIKRHASTVQPHKEEEEENDGDKEETEETAEEEEEKRDTMPELLPPVPMETFGRRGRRNTITVHRSSVAPDSIPDLFAGGSLISLKDEMETKTTVFEDSDGLLIESTLDLRECSCLEILNSVFPQLVRHWKAACSTARTVLFLTEAGGAAIATGNNISALSYLNDAREFIATLDGNEKPLPDDPEDNIIVTFEERARIESMTGQALFRLGRIEESMPHFHTALKILKNRQPSGKLGILLSVMSESWKQAMHAAFPSLCIGSASSNRCNRYVEQARCLSFIWEAYHRDNHKLKALAAALQELNRAESADDDLKELVNSYTNMMQCCQTNRWYKMGDYYEKLAMKRCVESPSAVGADDLITIGYLYCSSMVVRLANGRIQGAIDTGFSTLKVAKKLHDMTMEIKVLPLLAQTLLLANRHVKFVEMTKQLKYDANEEEDPVAECLYYACSLDLALSTGFLLVIPESCEEFCLKSAGEPGFSLDDSRFCLMASLALWYSRKSSWDKSEEWVRAAEKIRSRIRQTYITVHGIFKLAECKLIHFWYQQRMRMVSAHAETEARKCMAKAKKAMAEFPVFLPRYFHLMAHLHLLDGREANAKKYLQKCIDKSTTLCNQEELNWAQHNKKMWYSKSNPKHQDEFWTRSFHSDLDKQPNMANHKVVKYSLPHPSWQQN